MSSRKSGFIARFSSKKHLFIGQPLNAHAGAIEGLFNALQNGFELRNEVFVFATGPLDALCGRGTPAAGHVAQFLSDTRLRSLVMNTRIPIKIRVQHRREIESRLFLLLPGRKPDAIQALYDRIVRAELVAIAGRKVT